MPAVLLPFGAAMVAAALYTLYVPVILIMLFDMQTSHVTDPLNACLYLALIYAVLQSSFFILLNNWYRLNLQAIQFFAPV